MIELNICALIKSLSGSADHRCTTDVTVTSSIGFGRGNSRLRILLPDLIF